VVVATWFGYVIAFFTGALPKGIQDFIAGAMQWYTRVMAWLLGLTDEYPPFGWPSPRRPEPPNFGRNEARRRGGPHSA